MASDVGVIIETEGGLIVNRIVWSDEVPTMDFGEGLEAVQEPSGVIYAIGGTLIDGVYTPPPEPPPEQMPPPPPPVRDANERLDAGILAAVGTVITARDAIHAIPNGGAVPPRLDALVLQMKITMDAFVAMLQAQAATPPP